MDNLMLFLILSASVILLMIASYFCGKAIGKLEYIKEEIDKLSKRYE